MLIKFDRMVLPELKATKAQNGTYYMPNVDGKWFSHLLEYYNESSLHAAIINNLHRRLQKDYENDPLFYKISLDYILFGGYSIECLFNMAHTGLVSMNHLTFCNVRVGLQNEAGETEFYYYSNDWLKYNNRDIELMHAYDEQLHTDDHQCFYFTRYSPENLIYPKPYYLSGIREISTSVGLSTYYANLVKNSFNANMMLNMNQIMDEDRQKDFEKAIRNNFTDPSNAGTMLINYNEDKDHAPELIPFNTEEGDLKYRFIVEKVQEQIAIAHNIPVSLLGVLVPGKLGSATELPTYEAIYDKYVVQPIKNELTTSYEYLKSKMIVQEPKNNAIDNV